MVAGDADVLRLADEPDARVTVGERLADGQVSSVEPVVGDDELEVGNGLGQHRLEAVAPPTCRPLGRQSEGNPWEPVAHGSDGRPVSLQRRAATRAPSRTHVPRYCPLDSTCQATPMLPPHPTLLSRPGSSASPARNPGPRLHSLPSRERLYGGRIGLVVMAAGGRRWSPDS